MSREKKTHIASKIAIHRCDSAAMTRIYTRKRGLAAMIL